MRVICLEQEELTEGSIYALLKDLPQIEEPVVFSQAEETLDWLSRHRADLALLDLDLPGIDGIKLAAAIKAKFPDIAVVLVTSDAQYALEAFTLRASGFLLKPVSRERLEEELEYHSALQGIRNDVKAVMRTFGSFDCFVDGKPITFRQSRCKELLAYLVDRRGSSVTRAEAFAILWEDRLYDRSMQKQLDVIIRSLRATLRENGIDSILEVKNGTMRLNPEKIKCDLYCFLSGDVEAVRAYRKEYMNGYAWAEMTESYLTERVAENEK